MGKEPFQSLGTIIDLRNEIIHYKASLLGKDESPKKSIANLMKKLDISSDATWIDDDLSTWVADLMSSKSFSNWLETQVTVLKRVTHGSL